MKNNKGSVKASQRLLVLKTERIIEEEKHVITRPIKYERGNGRKNQASEKKRRKP